MGKAPNPWGGGKNPREGLGHLAPHQIFASPEGILLRNTDGHGKSLKYSILDADYKPTGLYRLERRVMLLPVGVDSAREGAYRAWGGVSFRTIRKTCSSERGEEAMKLEYDTRIEDEKGIIKIEGDLDNEQAGEALREAFNSLYNRGQRTIVLDLKDVEIINSYGIGKILMCYKRLKAEDGVLMVKPLSGFVKETFELLMLDGLFPVYEDAAP